MDNIIDKHFQEWLDESNPLNENEPDVRTKLMKYYNSILKIVEESGYKIDNKKEFKNELASMIYRLTYAKA
jgi:thermostable 8-oxoguanine DNA glycosylase